LGNNVAVWIARPSFRLPVGVHVPLAMTLSGNGWSPLTVAGTAAQSARQTCTGM